MQIIDGGVCAPAGFTANGIHCGIKKGRSTEDLALVESEVPCSAAAVFTKNLVKAEPVKLTKKHISNGRAQAVVLNAGNANACTGEQGYQAARRMANAAAVELGLPEQDVLICSTGVIGQQINIDAIESGIPELCAGLSKTGNVLARKAILTTDTQHKETAIETTIGGKAVKLGTMAKGSGMIHINMGTMLSVITTDCSITPRMLNAALRESVEKTYNCVSVDGDTSTNDTLIILANGLSGNPLISRKNANYRVFVDALNTINTEMARKIAGDGEGAEHLLECTVIGAKNDRSARALAKSVISSSLVKAAFFGKDANWGRILCAMGYSGECFNPEKASVFFNSGSGEVAVFEKGVPLNFDEERARIILSEGTVIIKIVIEDGVGTGTAWGCDLTYEYVKINGDYRT
ncbi:MAG TPA: bifunctional glutamate N-acetyltransferase/amino-acid acetyltransferase ArgJ [Treponema sp.]|nr:bifunctional glutamate N-acetyltransferase/amino-acid acetyltransferase ArgJ [Treponema sp.]